MLFICLTKVEGLDCDVSNANASLHQEMGIAWMIASPFCPLQTSPQSHSYEG